MVKYLLSTSRLAVVPDRRAEATAAPAAPAEPVEEKPVEDKPAEEPPAADAPQDPPVTLEKSQEDEPPKEKP